MKTISNWVSGAGTVLMFAVLMTLRWLWGCVWLVVRAGVGLIVLGLLLQLF